MNEFTEMPDEPHDARGPRIKIVYEYDDRTVASGWGYKWEVAPDQRHIRLDMLLDSDYDDWEWNRLPGDIDTTARVQSEAPLLEQPSAAAQVYAPTPLAAQVEAGMYMDTYMNMVVTISCDHRARAEIGLPRVLLEDAPAVAAEYARIAALWSESVQCCKVTADQVAAAVADLHLIPVSSAG